MGDPLEELEKISASEREESLGEGAQQALEAGRAREKAQREAAAQAARAAKAPGFVHSMRFFGLMFVGMLLFSGLATVGLEGDWWDWQVVGGLWGAWGLVFALFALDAATWKRRLPFQLLGFEALGGRDDSGSGRVPWLAFEITIRLQGAGGPQAEGALRQTLEILATRVNRAMQSDNEASFGGARVWRVREDRSVRGEATVVVHTTRLLEKWLRREVRLLHAAFPVAAVQVDAKYTGASYYSSPSD